MLASIKGQFDITRIYFNQISKRPDWIPDWCDVYCGNENSGDLTDNGKFFFLEEGSEEYYFTADDDISYPPTYAQDMIREIKKHNCIVTHHGRKLKGLNRNYYRGGHTTFACLHEIKTGRFIDVCGTGVTAFDTRRFNPVDLWGSEFQKMSDIIFSLEASIKGVPIRLIPHSKDYFGYLFPLDTSTIHYQQHKNCSTQSELANQIYINKIA